MQLLGSDVTLPIFEQEPRQGQALACWPKIHRPQALQHVRWGRHRIHITNIGRVMAEINNYVAAGGCRSVNAPSPHRGFPAPSLDNREASWERTGSATRTPAGLVPGPAHCDLAHVERNVPVVADAIWRIRDRLTNVATRLSAFSSDKAAPGRLVARSVLIRFETSCRGNQNGRRSRSEIWGMSV
jgi:hypothetical protein